MVTAIITAAGKNRRMIADLKKLGLPIQHKLLLDLHGKPVIIKTIENVHDTEVEECIVVLGHFSKEISYVLSKYLNNKIKLVKNHETNVELSDTLLNGLLNVKPDLCLCVAADQPTITSQTMQNLIKKVSEYPDSQNIVSILARGKSGFLNSTKGLGMPFVCHSKLLKNYLSSKHDNLNPILGNMLKDGVVFYGVPPLNDLELVNINQYEDYLKILNSL